MPAAILALTVLPLSAAGKNVKDVLQKLDRLMERENFAEAMPLVNSLLKTHPGNARALRIRAEIYSITKKYKLALRDYDRLLAKPVPQGKDYVHRGTVYLTLGDLARAEADLVRGIELEQASPPAYRNLAEIYFKQGKKKEAEAVLSKMVAAHPENLKTWRYKGEIDLRNGNGKAALADFDNCIRLSPMSHVYYLQKGDAQMLLKDYKGALSTYTKALEMEPFEVEEVYLKRAKAYEKLGMLKEAAADRARH
ncbi:MAG: tetratricopeptide repeat protein [Candidatus Melainabacteria bacterium]|nr:tetratricopeptide repeat protein [Candidatus Melainabacteria bacterium]